MTAFSESRRAEIVERAGRRCEYCHLPTRGQVATFPIDHIVPRTAGGATESENLALACPHCNAHKWIAFEGADPESGTTVSFFHPRRDDWNSHFEWLSGLSCELLGKTAVGRATVAGLRINDSGMVELRQLLAELGLFTECSR